MSRKGRWPGRDAAVPAAALEPLVLLVSVLDGGRAGSLLAGLAAPLRPGALRQLVRLERLGRAERHAALANTFAPSSPEPAQAAGIPGLLGAEVQRRLAPGGTPAGAPVPGPMERWARRLALELSVPDGGDGWAISAGMPPRTRTES